ncbi:MAG: hypothetical protein AAGJ86_12230 [Pseudomonadota bacterium]
MMRRLALLVVVLCSACGQSGDLFLPPDGSGETINTPAVIPADTESEDNEDDEETPAR